MKRLAIVEYLMSAGGVERVLRGLARAFLEVPEARSWEITFLLSRYNSAHHRSEWPPELSGPNLRVEWLGEHSAVSRMLDPLAHAQGVLGWKTTRIPAWAAAKAARGVGPLSWRALLGDPFSLIARASGRFDVMYFPYPFRMAVPPLKATVATTPQDFNFMFFTRPGTLRRRTEERAARAWLARADRVLLSSHAVEAELRRFYPEFAPKAQVIHLGIDADPPRPPQSELDALRASRGLPSEFVLVSGWVVPHKNQRLVVDAVAQLRSRGGSVPVVFVGPNTAHLGDGPAHGFRTRYVEEIRAALRSADLRLGRDYFALGYVSDGEIGALHRLATMFVCPSLYEGFGLPGLEAMLARCPVLLSAIPPLEEQNRLLGGVVRTFDPADPGSLAEQIEWVLSHRAEAASAAELAAKRVARVYDWKKTARAYLSVFDELVEAPRRAAS
jgi:glycosyltransferase involved in cell wall biosynthesis